MLENASVTPPAAQQDANAQRIQALVQGLTDAINHSPNLQEIKEQLVARLSSADPSRELTIPIADIRALSSALEIRLPYLLLGPSTTESTTTPPENPQEAIHALFVGLARAYFFPKDSVESPNQDSPQFEHWVEQNLWFLAAQARPWENYMRLLPRLNTNGLLAIVPPSVRCQIPPFNLSHAQFRKSVVVQAFLDSIPVIGQTKARIPELDFQSLLLDGVRLDGFLGLERLHLQGVQFTDSTAAQDFFESIYAGASARIPELDLRYMPLDGVKLEAFLGLAKLDLRGAKFTSLAAAQAFLDNIPEAVRARIDLKLSEMSIGGVRFDDFLRPTRLDLTGAGFENPAAVQAFLDSIPEAKRKGITELDLSFAPLDGVNLSGFPSLDKLSLNDARFASLAALQDCLDTISATARPCMSELRLRRLRLDGLNLVGFKGLNTLNLNYAHFANEEALQALLQNIRAEAAGVVIEGIDRLCFPGAVPYVWDRVVSSPYASDEVVSSRCSVQ
ncbi:MAG: hypothetical protein V4623_08930 [Pseudomonadota bacterium]